MRCGRNTVTVLNWMCLLSAWLTDCTRGGCECKRENAVWQRWYRVLHDSIEIALRIRPFGFAQWPPLMEHYQIRGKKTDRPAECNRRSEERPWNSISSEVSLHTTMKHNSRVCRGAPNSLFHCYAINHIARSLWPLRRDTCRRWTQAILFGVNVERSDSKLHNICCSTQNCCDGCRRKIPNWAAEHVISASKCIWWWADGESEVELAIR